MTFYSFKSRSLPFLIVASSSKGIKKSSEKSQSSMVEGLKRDRGWTGGKVSKMRCWRFRICQLVTVLIRLSRSSWEFTPSWQRLMQTISHISLSQHGEGRLSDQIPHAFWCQAFQMMLLNVSALQFNDLQRGQGRLHVPEWFFNLTFPFSGNILCSHWNMSVPYEWLVCTQESWWDKVCFQLPNC